MADRLKVVLAMCAGVLVGGLCADLEGVSWQVALFVCVVLAMGVAVHEFIKALR